MPETYFRRPCPACGGRVRHRSEDAYAECTACGRRFRMTPPAPPEDTPKNAPNESAPKSRFRDKLRAFFVKIKKRIASTYAALYRRLRKKHERLPLPRPKGNEIASTSPEPPMNEGQQALYRARKQQLVQSGNATVHESAPTKSERLERFILRHRILSISVSALALLLLLTLMTVGIAFCVKESSINKDPFRIYYGAEERPTRYEYEFIAFKVKTEEGRKISHRINMTRIATLCDLTISGTESAPRYALRGGSAYVKFESGSKLALVNGSYYEMDCPATYDENGNLWVDLYFADTVLGGLEILVDLETNTISVKRNTTPEGTVLDPVYENISISASGNAVSAGGSASLPTATYQIDISAYAADLYPTDPSYLILANKEHPLGADYAPADLSEANVPRTKTVELRSSAARAIEAMFAEMEANGITDISVTSSYRSYSYQEALFNHYVSEYQAEGYTYDEAVALVDRDTARAGYSEHQTGLCVDFLTSSMGGTLSNDFESSEASAWLRENAWKFGFILRYPSDKIDTTGYTYESWHYRFVGVDAATEIHTSGWCFEEYLDKH